MTNYYENKKRAIIMIDEMLEKGKKINEIEYVIGKKYGFGKKLIIERQNVLFNITNKEDESNN